MAVDKMFLLAKDRGLCVGVTWKLASFPPRVPKSSQEQTVHGSPMVMRSVTTWDVFLDWIGDTGGGDIGWLHMRDSLKDRGDSSAVLARQESWETKRVSIDVGAGAWCRLQTSAMWFMERRLRPH